MRVEASSTLTKRLLRGYLRYTTHRSQPGKTGLMIAGCLVVLGLSAGITATSPGQAIGPIGLALSSLILVGFLLMPRWSAYLQWRGAKPELATQRFTFLDDAFETEDAGAAAGKAKVRIVRYAGLLKAVEDRDAFYLFLRKDNAFIVAKSGFPEGGVEALRARLAEVLGRRMATLR